jgi:predicted nucleic acid-binding Zn ribbon protein
MATYIYETVPTNPKQKPRRFEVQQSMKDAPLTKDPETGLPVRRVISGGSGNIMRGLSILSMNRPRRGK